MRTFKIVTDSIVRDPRMERRIIEYNRDRTLYMLLFIGSVLIMLGILW